MILLLYLTHILYYNFYKITLNIEEVRQWFYFCEVSPNNWQLSQTIIQNMSESQIKLRAFLKNLSHITSEAKVTRNWELFSEKWGESDTLFSKMRRKWHDLRRKWQDLRWKWHFALKKEAKVTPSEVKVTLFEATWGETKIPRFTRFSKNGGNGK